MISPIDEFNSQPPIEIMLETRGDIQISDDKWLYSESESCKSGIFVFNNKMFSHHSNDPLADGYAHDPFDLYCHEKGLNVPDAVKQLAQEIEVDGLKIDLHNKRIYRERRNKTIKIPPYGFNDSFNTCQNHLDWTKAFTVSQDDMDKIAAPEWLYDNLIIKGHVHAIVAPPNGGKTTILMHIAEILANKIQVYYVNADVSAADAKAYYNQAESAGFTILFPDMKIGQSMKDVVNNLIEMNKTNQEYSNTLFIFDTLKKMTDVINKRHAKELYSTLRGLSAKGMTVVLLGHTNKHKVDGRDIYEGTGDLRADVDNLIYLVPQKNNNGSMTVSTDPDKKRGNFKPITFEISAERVVSQVDFVDTLEINKFHSLLQKDKLYINAILDCLSKNIKIQSKIIENCQHEYGVGKSSTQRVLDYFSTGQNKLWNKERETEHNNRITYKTCNINSEVINILSDKNDTKNE